MDIAFDRTLRTYADLTVKIGLNLEPNQRLLIFGPIANGGVSLGVVGRRGDVPHERGRFVLPVLPHRDHALEFEHVGTALKKTTASGRLRSSANNVVDRTDRTSPSQRKRSQKWVRERRT
jgi:hypothetical protein